MVLQSHDPIVTDGNLYRVIFENERVRVLEYRDRPGDRTHPHQHPDSVMYVLSDFRRRLTQAGQEREVELSTGQVRWVAAQEHIGENIGQTDSHVIFVELKDSGPMTNELGPQGA